MGVGKEESNKSNNYPHITTIYGALLCASVDVISDEETDAQRFHVIQPQVTLKRTGEEVGDFSTVQRGEGKSREMYRRLRSTGGAELGAVVGHTKWGGVPEEKSPALSPRTNPDFPG